MTAGVSGSKPMLPEDTAVAPAPGIQAVAGVMPAPGEAQLQGLILFVYTSSAALMFQTGWRLMLY